MQVNSLRDEKCHSTFHLSPPIFYTCKSCYFLRFIGIAEVWKSPISNLRSLLCRMRESLRRLGRAFAPALAPHLANVLASLDVFLLPGLFDAPRSASVPQATPPTRPFGSPDSHPFASLVRSDPDPDEATPSRPQSPDAEPLQKPSALIPLQASDSHASYVREPCPCSRVSRANHPDACEGEVLWSLLVAALPNAICEGNDTVVEAASAQEPSRTGTGDAITVPNSGPKASYGQAPSSSTDADVGAEKASEKAVGRHRAPAGPSSGADAGVGAGTASKTGAGKHAAPTGVEAVRSGVEGDVRADGHPRVDVTRDSMWLTFRDAQVEAAFQRSISNKRMKVGVIPLLLYAQPLCYWLLSVWASVRASVQV
jgi:hypothetical protein